MSVSRKQLFLNEASSVPNPSLLVICVQLPTGAKEVITNIEKLQDKVNYIIGAYDEDLTLKGCNQVKILDWMVV